MKNLLSTIVFLLSTIILFAQTTWSLDKGHSKVGFTVKHHMIAELDGNFTDYTAKITATKEDFSDAVFEFTAETKSFDTANEMRDGHLKDERYFDVEKFPQITFKSTSFTRVMGNEWKLVGDLTMKGKTLPVTLDVLFAGPQMNKRLKTMEIGVTATGKLNRLDFGVGDQLPEFNVSNEIELRILGEFRKEGE